MKILKIILITIGSVFLAFVLLGFAYFISLPSPPKAITKIANEEWNFKKEFPSLDEENWTKENDLLVFKNQSADKKKVTLYSSSIPSEFKKKGYITTSVTVSGGFKSIADDCIFGIQIGEKGADQRDQIFMGLNGKGEAVILDGTLNRLQGEKIKDYNGKLTDSEEATLKFHYYRNPYGWIIFFSAHNGKNRVGTHINHIPVEKLDARYKELSLVVYNPSQEGKLWFKDWNIQNDWTPND